MNSLVYTKEQLFQRRSRLVGMLPFLFPATYLFAVIIERVFPARSQPKIRGWLAVGLLFFLIAGVINTVIGPALANTVLGGQRLADLSWLGVVGGAIVAMLATELVAYWIHRGMHSIHPLWRWHQLHHSPPRVDVAGFSYGHPFDLALTAVLTSIVSIAIGVSPTSAFIAAYTLFALGVFGHLNVRTPSWIGWLVQRPEAHALHHGRDVHAYNYGAIPIIDILFGTFRNPRDFVSQTGFSANASRRVGAMLRGQDVSLL